MEGWKGGEKHCRWVLRPVVPPCTVAHRMMLLLAFDRGVRGEPGLECRIDGKFAVSNVALVRNFHVDNDPSSTSLAALAGAVRSESGRRSEGSQILGTKCLQRVTALHGRCWAPRPSLHTRCLCAMPPCGELGQPPSTTGAGDCSFLFCFANTATLLYHGRLTCQQRLEA